MSPSAPPAVRPGSGNEASRTWLAAGLLLLAGAIAYWGSLRGPFVYLDQSGIRDNPSIRHLWPLSRVLNPAVEPGVTVQGRPLVNLSFALNYAVGGTSVLGYHVVNLAIHLLAALALFGIVRRILERRGDPGALLAAWLVALLWTVHPLTTESVTYMVQRAESLMGLLYLATVYAFVRAKDSRGSGAKGWFAVSWLACLLGMATKEVMVSAPAAVLLLDAVFVSGSLGEAWRRAKGYYLGLFATWGLLIWLVAGTGGSRGGTSGFGLGISLWQYLLTQCDAIARYLKLSLWPDPLVFFYEVHWYALHEVILQGSVVVLLLLVGVVAGWRKPALGFLVLWFFALLAPTSLVPGRSQTVAEHRMYLALVPCMIGVVLGLRWLWTGLRLPRATYAVPLLGAAAGLACATAVRNRAYASEISLWEDTAAKAPGNPFTQNNLGVALSAQGRYPEAIRAFGRSVAIDPRYASGHDNLGLALAQAGRLEEAVAEYMKAIAIDPGLAEVRLNLGVALMRLGQPHEAVRQFETAFELNPKDPNTLNDLAGAELQVGRVPLAIDHYKRAVFLAPMAGQGWYNLGNAYTRAGRWTEAAGAYRRAAELIPASADARSNLGAALANTGDFAGAVEAYRMALALASNDADIHENLAQALRRLGNLPEAEKEHALASGLRGTNP